MNSLAYLKPIVITGFIGIASLAAGVTLSIGFIVILGVIAAISYLWYHVELPDPSDNQPTYDPEFVRERTARWCEPSSDVKARRQLRQQSKQRPAQSDSQDPTSSSSRDDSTSDDGPDSDAASLNLSELEYPWRTETDVSFSEVGGMTGIKQELKRDVIRPLTTHREEAEKLGISTSNIVFHGPPGTGKSYLSQAIASELGFPFTQLSGADVQSKWINESPQKIQTLFDEAKKVAADEGGAVVFLDELDSVLKSRDNRSAHEEDSKVVNEFLNHLETTSEHNIVFIGATNRLDALDEAGIRSGRIDKKVHIGLPDRRDRTKILRAQLADRPNSLSADQLEQIAGWTQGLSAADLEQLVENAARATLGRGDDQITWIDIRRVVSP